MESSLDTSGHTSAGDSVFRILRDAGYVFCGGVRLMWSDSYRAIPEVQHMNFGDY